MFRGNINGQTPLVWLVHLSDILVQALIIALQNINESKI